MTPQEDVALPRLTELHRREADGRVLVCYGGKGWYMIANDGDVATQSVVLTTEEVRWLYWVAFGGRESAAEIDRLEQQLARQWPEYICGHGHRWRSSRRPTRCPNCNMSTFAAADPKERAG